MKIGICTVYCARNYGAMLQAYALKTYLQQLGHEVFMLNDKQRNYTKWNPKPLGNKSLKTLLLYPKYLIKWYLPEFLTLRRRENSFDSFLKEYILPKANLEEDDFDVIIYGSDQIWSKFKSGYNRLFWGEDGFNAKMRMSYAVSMGVLDINNGDEVFIRRALSRFSYISVRERDLQEELTKRNLVPHTPIRRVLDPTFLFNKEEWIKLNPKRIVREPYLLFYDFQLDKTTTQIAQLIAKEKGLRIIRLTDGVVTVKKDNDYFVTAGPLEFVSLFCFADFVVSSSFHGTAFAIINQKQFYVRQVWNKERVKTLLDTFGLANRFIDDVNGINLYDEIDYDPVNSLLTTKRNEAIAFLKESLDE